MKEENVTTDSLCFDSFKWPETAQKAVASSSTGEGVVRALYLTSDAAQSYLTTQAKHVFGVVCHGIDAPNIPQEIPVASVAMTQLAAPPLLEIWTSDKPVSRGAEGSIVWGRSGDFLFGLYRQPPHEDGLESGTLHAYQQIFSLLKAQGTPHLLRVWNYFSAINADDADGMERYKHFCIGRYEAFAESDRLNVRDIPAASAVGSRGTAPDRRRKAQGQSPRVPPQRSSCRRRGAARRQCADDFQVARDAEHAPLLDEQHGMPRRGGGCE